MSKYRWNKQVNKQVVGVVVCKSRVLKLKEQLPFCREFRILCIEDGMVVDFAF